jgi:DNA-binding NarL/FixJ family response regulator
MPGPSVGQIAPAASATSVIAAISAEEGLLRRRIVAALSADGIAVRPRLDANAADGTADVLVFVHDLSQPERVTKLRSVVGALGSAPAVLISPPAGPSELRRALNAGIRGLVFETEIDAALAPVVRAVAANHTCVPRSVKLVVDKPALSHREREVLRLAVSGRTNGEIAAMLCLAESTVKSHLSAAFSRLGVRSRREAATLVLDPAEGLGPLILGSGGPAASTGLPGAPAIHPA